VKRIVVVETAPSGVDVEREETHAFLRGLDKAQFLVERRVVESDGGAVAAKEDSLPRFYLNDKLSCKGVYPSADELSGVLRLGCEDAPPESGCCASQCGEEE
jgi:hypothetical protein